MSNNSELENIKSLLLDFPSKKQISPNDALKIISVRYQELNNLIYSSMISGINESSQPISEIFFLLIQYFHKKLCDDIFSNAGKFRNISDPDEGKVHYGPYNPKIGRMAKFDGCYPENIYRELIELTSILSLKDTNSIFTAIKFYQRFVYIHPFYDTNGRIGRLLTKLYLVPYELNS